MDKTPTDWMIEPLRRYAQFGGRARRAEYWWFVLFALLVALVAFILDSLLGLRPARGGTGLIGGLTSLALFIPHLAVTVRRLHDIDRTGWWIGGAIIGGLLIGVMIGIGVASGSRLGVGVLSIVGGLAIIGYSILMIVWHCTRGTDGPNRYGANPLTAAD